jgi:hypothetical protein
MLHMRILPFGWPGLPGISTVGRIVSLSRKAVGSTPYHSRPCFGLQVAVPDY